jgi:DNA-binding NtrC family response regulator
MNANSSSDQTSAVVILNASLDLNLREIRAKILNQAGYYTSSAESAEEVIHLAACLRCPIVIVCHSFDHAERGRIHDRIREAVPAAKVILLNHFADTDPSVLIDTVKKALHPKS